MSPLRDLLHDYLTMRRGLGYKLHIDGTGLSTFVGFMEQQQADSIRTDLALTWAKQPTAFRTEQGARRLGYVRGFAR